MMTLNLRDSFSATKHQHFRPFTISKLYIIKAVVGVGRLRRPILFCHSVGSKFQYCRALMVQILNKCYDKEFVGLGRSE